MTMGFTLIGLFMSALIISYFVNRIVKPIKMLAAETEQIKQFNLDGNSRVVSRIKEVMLLKSAIDAMKKGLRHFQRYVPKVLVQQLIALGPNAHIDGEKKQLAVFFSDIENFTSIAETMEPQQLIRQLGEYFEALTQIIILENGTIDKYIGDSIMAFWGAPLVDDAGAIHAARAALRCQEKLISLNAKWRQLGLSPLQTRMGIHLGDAIVGNLGSSERWNYTAIGDTVNIASRLEGLNKAFHSQIVVSDKVYEQTKAIFTFKLLGSVALKGRSEKIVVYELLGEKT